MATPNLTEVITQGIERMFANVHTAIPGIVESYDDGTNTVSVRPALKRKYVEESAAVELPIISRVPVLFPRTANAHLALPVAQGDSVLLVFSERGIAKWLDRGGTVDPEEPAMFSINDAIAIPGIYPLAEPPARNGAASSVEMANGTSYLEIKDTGEIRMKATKIVLESTDVNLGDEAGNKVVTVADFLGNVLDSTAAPCTILPTGGTLKTKAS